VIVAIAGRRAASTRVLLDALLADVAHSFTADPAEADVVVLLDTPPDLGRLRPESVVVAYADDSAIARATKQLAARVVTFGLSASNDVRAEAIESTLDGTRFVLVSGDSTAPVELALLGESAVPLVLAALTVAASAGIPTAESIAGLARVAELAPHDMRVSRPEPGVVLVDDAGDASPRSTADALKALAQFTTDGTRSVAVLGQLDLPADADAIESRDEHDRIGRLVVRLNVSRLIVVGQAARHIHNAAGLEGSWDGESVLVDTPDEAYDLLRDTEFSASATGPLVLLVKTGASANPGDLAHRLALTTRSRRATS
jgi:UDP-N-acetylmuramoyl-tripeptide--D-alanyl-D-alanine ligase